MTCHHAVWRPGAGGTACPDRALVDSQNIQIRAVGVLIEMQSMCAHNEGGSARVLAYTPGHAGCCRLPLLLAADRQPERGEGRGRRRQPQVASTVPANVSASTA